MSDPTDHSQPTVDEIEADIARSRDALAATVDELTGRLDVKARMKTKVEQTKQGAADQVHSLRDRATDEDGRPTSPAIAGAVAAVAVVVLLVWWRRR